MIGWIKLHRQFLDHWLCDEYRPLTKREAWENMLFYANYSDDKVMIKGQLIECSRGQICYSLETYARKFNWSIGQVRQFFQLLKNDGMIKVEGMKYTTRLTICNYDNYQDKQQTANILPTDCQQTDNILPATSKDDKETKKVKKVKKFLAPTIEEVKNYCQERNNSINPEKFFNHYEAVGWMVNKNKMKDWKAAVRTWENNEFNKNGSTKNIENHAEQSIGSGTKQNPNLTRW